MSTVRFRPRAPFLVLSQFSSFQNARVAQLVEQRIENPCVDGSIPPPGTTVIFRLVQFWWFSLYCDESKIRIHLMPIFGNQRIDQITTQSV